MATMALIAHVFAQFIGGPSTYNFPTMYLCQASYAGVGLFDLLLSPAQHVSRDAKVTVSMTGDAMSYSFDWNPPDPMTGIQGIRIRVFDSTTGVLVNPDDLRVTIERLDRI